MATPRRFLPSIAQLTAFEAVLRTGSTQAAARDLSLTQGTVSRLIQSLEAQLGVTLFRRERRALIPTEQARAYGRDIVKALDLISRGSMRVRANMDGGTLSLAILPSFGTRWLAPRLPGFLRAHPGITLNLGTRLRPFDFDSEGFDAAIHFGADDWGGTQSAHLFDEGLIACAAPALLAEHGARGPEDLPRLPLLQLETRPNAWAAFLARHGITAAHAGGMLFDQFAPLIQAAIHGLGVALLPDFLAQPELDEGRLVALHPDPVTGSGGYYLVWPPALADYPPLVAFRRWLVDQAADPGGESMLPR